MFPACRPGCAPNPSGTSLSPPPARAVTQTGYFPSKLSPQSRGFLTVDYYSNHFPVRSAVLSLAASPALPGSALAGSSAGLTQQPGFLPAPSLPSSLPPSVLLPFLPPSLPPSGCRPAHTRVPGSSRDPCPGMDPCSSRQGQSAQRCLRAAAPRFDTGKMRGALAVAGGNAGVALRLLEELDWDEGGEPGAGIPKWAGQGPCNGH